MSGKERLLVIGLGNPLMGDDGVGIHVIHELKKHHLPENVEVMDGGTAGVDLVDLLSTYRETIMIDAIRNENDHLSNIRLFSPDDLIYRKGDGNYSIHDMELTTALSLMKTLNIKIPDITIIGIPAVIIAPEVGLSAECSRFVPEAVGLIIDMVHSPISPFIKGDKGIKKGESS